MPTRGYAVWAPQHLGFGQARSDSTLDMAAELALSGGGLSLTWRQGLTRPSLYLGADTSSARIVLGAGASRSYLRRAGTDARLRFAVDFGILPTGGLAFRVLPALLWRMELNDFAALEVGAELRLASGFGTAPPLEMDLGIPVALSLGDSPSLRLGLRVGLLRLGLEKLVGRVDASVVVSVPLHRSR